MYFSSPRSGDLFYLRTLLLYVWGPTSYEDLCTSEEGQGPYITPDDKFDFRAACCHRGLCNDNSEYNAALTKARTISTPAVARYLFISCLIDSEGSNLLSL